MEHTGQIGVDDRAERLIRHHHGEPVPDDSGIVDKHANTAEGRLDLPEHSRDLFLTGHIRSDDRPASAHFENLIERFCGALFIVMVMHHNRDSALRQPDRACPADSARRTGHQGHRAILKHFPHTAYAFPLLSISSRAAFT